jgi:hypothetical protein
MIIPGEQRGDDWREEIDRHTGEDEIKNYHPRRLWHSIHLSFSLKSRMRRKLRQPTEASVYYSSFLGGS